MDQRDRSIPVGLALRLHELERLDAMAAKYASGNRSEMVRRLMDLAEPTDESEVWTHWVAPILAQKESTHD